MANEKLNSAIAAYKNKNIAAARQLLTEIVREDAKNEIAWLYLSACVPNVDQKKTCLSKVLALNPNNQQARQMMAKLSAANPSPGPAPAPKPVQQPQRPRPGSSPSAQNQPRPNLKACPYCGEMIQTVAIVCRFCGRDLSSPVVPSNMTSALYEQMVPQPSAMRSVGLRCIKHPDREAAGICTYSGKPYCAEDLVEVSGKMYAREHLDKVFSEVKEQATKQQAAMPTIVVNANSSASNIVNMGRDGHLVRGTKSRMISLILCLGCFLGFGGLHRFYTGKLVTGIIQFLTVGGFGIWQLIDLLMILGGSYRDAKGEPLI